MEFKMRKVNLRLQKRYIYPGEKGKGQGFKQPSITSVVCFGGGGLFSSPSPLPLTQLRPMMCVCWVQTGGGGGVGKYYSNWVRVCYSNYCFQA